MALPLIENFAFIFHVLRYKYSVLSFRVVVVNNYFIIETARRSRDLDFMSVASASNRIRAGSLTFTFCESKKLANQFMKKCI